jgi:hypothetical protein
LPGTFTPLGLRIIFVYFWRKKSKQPMKRVLLFIALTSFFKLAAQQRDPSGVRQTIDHFFEGFHARDSMVMKEVLSPSLKLRSISRDQEGQPVMRIVPISNFLMSMASLPDTLRFSEKLLDYTINVDGDMAHAWTPYAFYLSGDLHHCGVNSFQLFHDGTAWRIIALSDTRRTEGCQP